MPRERVAARLALLCRRGVLAGGSHVHLAAHVQPGRRSASGPATSYRPMEVRAFDGALLSAPTAARRHRALRGAIPRYFSGIPQVPINRRVFVR